MVLTGKRALVCGATQGIGRACALELARLGAEVTVVARDETALKALSRQLPSGGRRRHGWLRADFGAPAALERAVRRRLRQWAPVHILVNNTGGPPAGTILEAEPEAFLAAFTSHLLCSHVLARLLVPGMKAAGYGRVINIVSTSVRQPLKGLGVSNTIRAAVANWAKTLAAEVAASGVTVNCILPGATRTARLDGLISAKAQKTGKPPADVAAAMLAAIPAGRFADPAEIAVVAAFLAGPGGAYITGTDVTVDGGRLAVAP